MASISTIDPARGSMYFTSLPKADEILFCVGMETKADSIPAESASQRCRKLEKLLQNWRRRGKGTSYWLRFN
jgi:hypothetical protein